MDLLLHLRAFVAVAEEGHVTRAAAKLGTAQPVLSRQLQTLERELDVALFDRARGRLRLSDGGQSLLPAARDLVQRADQLLTGTTSALRSATRTVRLTVPHNSDPGALAEAIAAAATRRIRLAVIEADADERGDRLADGGAELALLAAVTSPADFVVPLGLGGAHAAPDGASVPLDRLRPRSGRGRGPVIMVPPEDRSALIDDLRRAAARAGLGADQIEAVDGGSGSAARALSGTDLLLCSRAEAYRYGLSWRALVPGRQRAYALAVRGRSSQLLELADELRPLLRRSLGGRPPQPATDPDRTPGVGPAVIFG